MNHNSIVLTEPTYNEPAGDPYAELAKHIILRAKRDYRIPQYRSSAHMFFCGTWYKDLFDYLTLCAVDFDPDSYILPEGVSGSERSVVRE